MPAGYSKTRVNRAGALFAEQVRLATEDEREIGQRRDELVEAIEIIEWWRGQHARPLSQVATNLRYYAAEEGKPIVAAKLDDHAIQRPRIHRLRGREPGR